MELPSTKPYLLRAIWEWCCDNGFTPHIAVQVDERTRVPREFVRDGQIVLNLGSERDQQVADRQRLHRVPGPFGGVARELVGAGRAGLGDLFARENGAGMAFEIDGEVLMPMRLCWRPRMTFNA
jgi:stringent starvation protein B